GLPPLGREGARGLLQRGVARRGVLLHLELRPRLERRLAILAGLVLLGADADVGRVARRPADGGSRDHAQTRSRQRTKSHHLSSFHRRRRTRRLATASTS